MSDVLLSVAPVSAAATSLDPSRVVEDVLRCAELGAGMVHLHVRDKNNQLTEDVTVFSEMIDEIRKHSDIIIQASTGGVSALTIQQRCAPLDLDTVECSSLNVGSVNLGEAIYKNPINDVKYCVSQMKNAGIVPEIEVFEIGMIQVALDLQKEFDLPLPLLFNIVLGHKGAAPPTVEALMALERFVPKDMLWGITHFGRECNDIFAAAVTLGAKTIRVGFEDSDYIADGKRAASNAEVVAHVVELLSMLERKPMQPNAARAMLGITR